MSNNFITEHWFLSHQCYFCRSLYFVSNYLNVLHRNSLFSKKLFKVIIAKYANVTWFSLNIFFQHKTSISIIMRLEVHCRFHFHNFFCIALTISFHSQIYATTFTFKNSDTKIFSWRTSFAKLISIFGMNCNFLQSESINSLWSLWNWWLKISNSFYIRMIALMLIK